MQLHLKHIRKIVPEDLESGDIANEDWRTQVYIVKSLSKRFEHFLISQKYLFQQVKNQ